MRAHGRAAAAVASTVLAVALGACGSSSTKGSVKAGSGGSSSAPASTTTSGGAGGYYGGGSATTAGASATTAASAATVSIGTTSLGKVLVDSRGMTLYVFDGDSGGKSSCNGGCASAWPPLGATGTATYGAGLSASMFSTITRSDGSTQIAVNGQPLYGWQGDQKPGDVTGQGVNGFHVVGPDGKKITG
jgi:predicted lipoprotein with Yx(FWY)xxD motif